MRSIKLSTAVGLAAAGSALAAALFSGSAQGQVISAPWPVSLKGTVEIRGYPGDNSCIQLYTPPSPYKLRITDLSLDSYGSTVAIPYQYICTGAPVCSAARSSYMTAPAGNTMVQNWSTGILVNAGETLSVCNYGGIGRLTSWTFHGFLYQ